MWIVAVSKMAWARLDRTRSWNASVVPRREGTPMPTDDERIAGSIWQSRMWSVLSGKGLAGGALVVGAHLGPGFVEVAVEGE